MSKQPGFRVGAIVRFIGGPFTGHVGRVEVPSGETVAGTPLVLVTVRRVLTQGPRGPVAPYETYSQFYVHPYDLTEVC